MVKRYLLILLIAFFTVAASGSVVMAHCDNSAQGRDNASIEKKMDGCSHSHSAKDKKHGDHKKIDEKTHGCCNTGPNDPTSSDDKGMTTSCLDCGAGLCHTQNIVTAKTSAVFYARLNNFITPKDVNLSAVFLKIIPDPPNKIS